jgi:hypothetical protein
MEAEAFDMLEKNFSEEWRNEAYALVLDQTGKFIEKHKLRNTNFPKRANSAFYILALGLAKNSLVFKPEEAEKYLNDQLIRIRDGGFDVVEEIFHEVISNK